MQSRVNAVLDYVVNNRVMWAVLRRTVVRLGQALAEQYRFKYTKTRWIDIEQATRQLSPTGAVLNGPFAGMRYPEFSSAGSALFPKLLGSYERELNGWIHEGDAIGYRAIVDVGCAEGYYAVGLARRWPQAQVYAFDTDPRARRLCLGLAQANGVCERVHVRERCDADVLRALMLPEPSLILSDCEGFELELFDETLLKSLQQHDFLIELHDWFDINISTVLKGRFQATHDVESIYSLDDVQKVHHYDYPELASWNGHDRRLLLSERRPYVMEWIYCRSRARRLKAHAGRQETSRNVSGDSVLAAS